MWGGTSSDKVRGTVGTGYGGYGYGVRWVRVRSTVSTGAGYGGYGYGVRWVRVRGYGGYGYGGTLVQVRIETGYGCCKVQSITRVRHTGYPTLSTNLLLHHQV